jgi:hypothetical protein
MFTFDDFTNFFLNPFCEISYFLIKRAHLQRVFVLLMQEVLLEMSSIFTQCLHSTFSSNPLHSTICYLFWESTSSFSLKVPTTTLDEGY